MSNTLKATKNRMTGKMSNRNFMLYGLSGLDAELSMWPEAVPPSCHRLQRAGHCPCGIRQSGRCADVEPRAALGDRDAAGVAPHGKRLEQPHDRRVEVVVG